MKLSKKVLLAGLVLLMAAGSVFASGAQTGGGRISLSGGRC
jgi:hypothetical protein